MVTDKKSLELKTQITKCAEGYAKHSKDLVKLLVECAEHYHGAGNRDVSLFNHFITVLKQFPRLKAAAIGAIDTFGMFSFVETDGKITAIENNKEAWEALDKDQKVTAKAEYLAQVAIYKAADHNSLLNFIPRGKAKPFDYQQALDKMKDRTKRMISDIAAKVGDEEELATVIDNLESFIKVLKKDAKFKAQIKQRIKNNAPEQEPETPEAGQQEQAPTNQAPAPETAK